MYDLFNFPHTRTYDDDLGWLIHVVKKLDGDYSVLLEKIEKMEDAFDSIDPKIQAAIAEMKQQIADALAEINKTVADAIAALNQQVDAKLQEIEERVNALIAEVKEEVKEAIKLIYQMEQMILDYQNANKAYVDRKTAENLEEMKNYLDEKLIEYSGKMISLSPVDGQRHPTDNVLDDMYRRLGWGVEAGLLDALGITAQEIENMRVPAGRWDTHAMYYLKKWWDKKNHVHDIANPFTGHMDRHKWVIANITDKLQLQKGVITCSEMDAMDITAGQFDDLQLRALEMDWKPGWASKWKEENPESGR